MMHQIGNMEDAMHLGDEVIRRLSIELMSDYANIRISSGGITEDFPIGNLDIEEMKRKILSITACSRENLS
ncbi:hypothetical protein TcWFU_003843 [Taenia crassiceps]|uniref:Uncharacterized protein n=1 Tax=Taenia crassiceps TaxID=6207 RepID=A0ABR4QRY0_9CEST